MTSYKATLTVWRLMWEEPADLNGVEPGAGKGLGASVLGSNRCPQSLRVLLEPPGRKPRDLRQAKDFCG
jgi:hypothetical protein